MDKFKEEWIAYQKTSLQSQITNLAYENFELEQENARLRNQSRWIPVTEKLPCKPGTFSEKLQALTPEGHYCIVTCWISIDFPLLPKWYLDRETYHLDTLMAVDVEYYMPILPDPQEAVDVQP